MNLSRAYFDEFEAISMVHLVIIGAGIGGLPTAYELRRLSPKRDKRNLTLPVYSITLIF